MCCVIEVVRSGVNREVSRFVGWGGGVGEVQMEWIKSEIKQSAQQGQRGLQDSGTWSASSSPVVCENWIEEYGTGSTYCCPAFPAYQSLGLLPKSWEFYIRSVLCGIKCACVMTNGKKRLHLR